MYHGFECVANKAPAQAVVPQSFVFPVSREKRVVETGGPLCLVEFEDYARLAEHWLKSARALPGDLDGDLDVDYADFELFVREWLLECPYDRPLR
ncbi:MAG: hypothetical protein ACYTEQ_06010 [Planctomycetota bacterium]